MRVSYVRFDGAIIAAPMAELLRRCRKRGWQGRLDGPSSGSRTYAQQKRFWVLYRAGKGAPAFNPDAPDPNHLHRHMRSNIAILGGWSNAVDVSRPEQLIETAKKEGVELHRPYLPRETWHVEAKKPFRLKPRGGKKMPSDLTLIMRMRKHGIVNPIWTLQAARKTKTPLPLACALLQQETGGGRNVFGHDPTRSIPKSWMGKTVTKARYLVYKRNRKRGLGMQGVGPTQLTWYSYQDEADAKGGCWKPYPNMLVGFALVLRSIKARGWHDGLKAYNGSGAAAERYATSVTKNTRVWRARLFA